MLEYFLQVVILAIIFLCIFLEHLKHKELKLLLNQEGNLVKENLNYIASAIVGLSELLDEADQVINQVSQVPSMGEMMQQMIYIEDNLYFFGIICYSLIQNFRI